VPTISIKGLAFRQRQNRECPEFLLFNCTASELLLWCDIDRLEARPGGQQRKKSDTKIRSIKRFFDNPCNTIPTAVVVSVDLPNGFSREVWENDVVEIGFALNEGDSKPGLIIDGQHRLLGMLECNEALKISVTAILTNDQNEPAFQFLIINNKAARVSTDHVKAILAEQQDDGLTRRLRAARLSVGNRFVFVDNAGSSPILVGGLENAVDSVSFWDERINHRTLSRITGS